MHADCTHCAGIERHEATSAQQSSKRVHSKKAHTWAAAHLMYFLSSVFTRNVIKRAQSSSRQSRRVPHSLAPAGNLQADGQAASQST